MNYSREKRYLENHAAYIVQTIINCFERLYCNLFGGEEKYEVNVNSDEGDKILYDVICLLNCNVYCKPEDRNDEELLYAKELQSLLKLYSPFARMEVFASCTEDRVIDSFLAINRYGVKYFSIENIDVL